MSRYPTLCHQHKEHTENCNSCHVFDMACREQLKDYTPSPQNHPMVVAIRIKEWIATLFTGQS